MTAPLILLPGMMCDARLWAPQVAALGGAVPIYGASDTISGMARAVLSAAPPRFALAGLSMGGIVAMAVMAAAPERVTRLALLDTNARAETPRVAARRGPQIARVADGGLRAVMRDEMKPHYLGAIAGPGRDAILATCMDMALDAGPVVFAAQSRALMARPDYRDVLRSVSVPVLVLCGARDTLCPPSNHVEMTGLMPHATLRVLPGAGHLPVLERPDAVNAALSDWLAA